MEKILEFKLNFTLCVILTPLIFDPDYAPARYTNTPLAFAVSIPT